MICPKCSTEMNEEKHGGVQLDLCPECLGVWFDGGELMAYQAGAGSPALEGAVKSGARFEPSGDSTHIKCPGCERDILRTGHVGKQDVMRCTCCGGLFLHLNNTNDKGNWPLNMITSAFKVLEEIATAIF